MGRGSEEKELDWRILPAAFLDYQEGVKRKNWLSEMLYKNWKEVTGDLNDWNIRWQFRDNSFNQLKLPVSINHIKTYFAGIVQVKNFKLYIVLLSQKQNKQEATFGTSIKMLLQEKLNVNGLGRKYFLD